MIPGWSAFHWRDLAETTIEQRVVLLLMAEAVLLRPWGWV